MDKIYVTMEYKPVDIRQRIVTPRDEKHEVSLRIVLV